MKELLKRLSRLALLLSKRFLADRPANSYEQIIFNAIRLSAAQFGVGRTKVA